MLGNQVRLPGSRPDTAPKCGSKEPWLAHFLLHFALEDSVAKRILTLKTEDHRLAKQVG